MGSKKRTSKSDWFEAALQVLRDEGVTGVRVDRLARDLGTSRSGFYWHFENRPDLLSQLLDHWSHEYTGVVVQNPELRSLEPRERLTQAAIMIFDHRLTAYDLSFHAWAAHDADVARRVRGVTRDRMEFIGGAFADLGFTGEELEMRTRLFVCYTMWERTTYPRVAKKHLRKLIAGRIKLLTSR